LTGVRIKLTGQTKRKRYTPVYMNGIKVTLQGPSIVRYKVLASMLHLPFVWSSTTELAALARSNRQATMKALVRCHEAGLVEKKTTGKGAKRMTRWRMRDSLAQKMIERLKQ
jgi:hypothetical protein